MLKLFKTVIKGTVGSETYERDTGHRMTMGYDAVSKSIKVKVEEVIPPNPNLDEELPEDTPTVLREPHETASFQTAAERTFIESDFDQRVENCKWIVEYDSETKTISDPLDVYEISKLYINNSNSHEQIYSNLNEYRYQADGTKTPLFVLDSFYKTVKEFDGCVIQFFVEDVELDMMDTILEGAAANAEPVTPKEYEYWVQYNTRPNFGFEILDEEGKIISSPLPTVAAGSKSATQATMAAVRPREDSDITPGLVGPASLGANTTGNRFKVTLESNSSYNVRILCSSRMWKLLGSNPTATIDLETINGVSNKSRVNLPIYTPGQTAEPTLATQEFIDEHPSHIISGANASFAGAEQVTVSTVGLRSGDYVKLKLNAGLFTSYAELWIVIQ